MAGRLPKRPSPWTVPGDSSVTAVTFCATGMREISAALRLNADATEPTSMVRMAAPVIVIVEDSTTAKLALAP